MASEITNNDLHKVCNDLRGLLDNVLQEIRRNEYNNDILNFMSTTTSIAFYKLQDLYTSATNKRNVTLINFRNRWTIVKIFLEILAKNTKFLCIMSKNVYKNRKQYDLTENDNCYQNCRGTCSTWSICNDAVVQRVVFYIAAKRYQLFWNH